MIGLPELVHHASSPVTLDRARRYAQDQHRVEIAKPNGLWVSVPGDESWETWCVAEKFGVDRLSSVHRVILKPGRGVLNIDDTAAFDRFAAEYLVPDENPYYAGGMAIDWNRVAERHDGILIAPHRWDRRGAHRWYSGWDCASGCIWNLDAVESFELVRR